MSKDEKLKALNLALSQIEKDFGKEAIMRLGDTSNENVEAIPTGALPLDIAIGIGGIPRGRIIEILNVLKIIMCKTLPVRNMHDRIYMVDDPIPCRLWVYFRIYHPS